MNSEIVPQYLYTAKELDRVSSYIEQQYGEFETVGHEMASPDIHCDVVVVPPTEKQPYYKLITMGAGAYKMKVPKGLSGVCDRAEYVVYLPKEWNLKSDKEEYWWPIRMLKTVARLPLMTNDWLYIGHTVNLTEDGSPVAANTEFNSCALFVSVGKDGKVTELGFTYADGAYKFDVKTFDADYALVKAKPASAKGQYFKSVTLTNTMGPGIKVSPLKYA